MRIKILEELMPFEAKLIAVSKTKPVSMIQAMYDQGQRIFGENRVQELVSKNDALPKDIEWHLIGHLQTNKVKYIAPFVSMIHAVDSTKLLKEINKQAKNQERKIPCLLQVKIAEESTKYGFSRQEIFSLLASGIHHQLSHVEIHGIMGMATFTDDMSQVRKEFRFLKSVFEELRLKHFIDDTYFKEISMGMSGDYHIALEEGSTMVRIGSLLFGSRS